MPVKLHADQLTDGGGAANWLPRFGALSADHLEYTIRGRRCKAMGQAAATVAVLLPGAYATVGASAQPPPVAAFRANTWRADSRRDRLQSRQLTTWGRC